MEWLAVTAEAVASRTAAGSVDLDGFARLRSSLFDPTTPNKYSRVIVSEHSDMITTLPADEMPLPAIHFNGGGGGGAGAGGLAREMPPMLRAQLAEMARLQAAQAAQLNAQQELQQANPFVMFLSTSWL
jgi:hypothetical protein